LRTASRGSLARFSDQLVSSTPVCGLSTASVNPFFSQKLRSCGQSCSGVIGTTSQRCWPRRSTRMSPTRVGATSPSDVWVVGTAEGAEAAAAALTTPACGW
jgi:hypothetical protein